MPTTTPATRRRRGPVTADPPIAGLTAPMAGDADAGPEPPELLNRREAAERAHVHYNTIRLWESQRLLTVRKVKIGRREEVRIDAAELDRVAAEKAEVRPAGAKAGQLMLPAETLWGMYQDAGNQLAAALEQLAALRVEAAMRTAEAERERERAEAAEARTDHLVATLSDAAASSRRWWQRAR